MTLSLPLPKYIYALANHSAMYHCLLGWNLFSHVKPFGHHYCNLYRFAIIRSMYMGFCWSSDHFVKCCSLWSCASGALFGLLGAMLSELFINWAIYTNKVGASPATALSLRTQPLQAEGLAQAIANMESAMEQEVPEGEEPKSGVAVVADLFSLKNGPPADSLTGCVVLIGAILCYWLLVHNMDMCHLMNMG
ncbi:uncharacterized protein [Triticum aestivum]|uniref:uncharacterized protein isoform X2 n=1 Tax=Triticum aestivum TaxID=4565 RepID=UPI001D010BE6|nr:uncharacterized protein LOC123167590 isoform X2 [Triticum aestivum]